MSLVVEASDPVAREISRMSRAELEEYACALAKNVIAIDGTWFQAVERDAGMDDAMRYDIAAWEAFSAAEARRAKRLLGMGEHPGLEGLVRALGVKATSLANDVEAALDDEGLSFRVKVCRVQTARARKGMPYHPCKPAGLAEYAVFARAIDDRIECECVSCYPDATDETCACVWRFRIGKGTRA